MMSICSDQSYLIERCAWLVWSGKHAVRWSGSCKSSRDRRMRHANIIQVLEANWEKETRFTKEIHLLFINYTRLELLSVHVCWLQLEYSRLIYTTVYIWLSSRKDVREYQSIAQTRTLATCLTHCYVLLIRLCISLLSWQGISSHNDSLDLRLGKYIRSPKSSPAWLHNPIIVKVNLGSLRKVIAHCVCPPEVQLFTPQRSQ